MRIVIALARDAGRFENLQHRREDQPIRHRPGDVADDNAGRFSPASQFGQRRRAVRPLEQSPQIAYGIGQRRRILVRQLANDPVARQFDIQAGSTIFKAKAHGSIHSMETYRSGCRGRNEEALSRSVRRALTAHPVTATASMQSVD